ncbi:MAG: riboflavin kinase [Bryobacteraceae bacterium]
MATSRQACRFLERPYWLEGDIVSGHGVGSKQTVPTLNLSTAAELLPAHGVYISRTHDSSLGPVLVFHHQYREEADV